MISNAKREARELDLGLNGRTAIICASSKGLGKACAIALAAEGADVIVNGRDSETLLAAVAEIAAVAKGKVIPIVADLTTVEGRARLLEPIPQPDILVTNCGGPPFGNFRNFNRTDWLSALEGNMLSAIDLIKGVIDPMILRRHGRIVNITSVAVKAPIAELCLSNGARSGLTGFVAGLAREVSHASVTINNILPGTFATDRILEQARHAAAGITVDEQLAIWKAQEVSGRMGRPHELGALCAFLCSEHAGYITGQNILMDGGGYPGTF
jgi:3-oxoacyl-[acyl-carrier protein] reductase